MSNVKKPVVALHPSGKVAGWFDSINEAAIYIGIGNKWNIKKSCRSHKHTCKGFMWWFKDEYEDVLFSGQEEILKWEMSPFWNIHGGYNNKKGRNVSNNLRGLFSEIMKRKWREGIYNNEHLHKPHPLICNETGEVIESMKVLSEITGLTYRTIRQRIVRGKEINGYTYRYGDTIKRRRSKRHTDTLSKG